jgi:glycerophosphoryl diester phosphodiesterase
MAGKPHALATAATISGLCLAALGCRDLPLPPFILNNARPLIFSHRGGGGIAPEATIPTMLDNYSRNPQAVVEFDIHSTSDGQLVVIHDAAVDRTTNGTGLVSDLTLAQLKMLDAAYCATPNQGNGTDENGDCHTADPAGFPFRGMAYQVPTLQEVLDALPVEALLSVEVKRPGIERQVADVLRASGRLAKMVVGAEFDAMAARIKDALPEVPGYLPTGAAKCFVISTKAGWDFPACPSYEIFASPLSGAGLALDTHGIIEAAHHRGMAVVYWTINDDPTMERIFRLGADGLYTDYPDRARLVLERLRAQGALK